MRYLSIGRATNSNSYKLVGASDGAGDAWDEGRGKQRLSGLELKGSESADGSHGSFGEVADALSPSAWGVTGKAVMAEIEEQAARQGLKWPVEYVVEYAHFLVRAHVSILVDLLLTNTDRVTGKAVMAEIEEQAARQGLKWPVEYVVEYAHFLVRLYSRCITTQLN